MGVFISHCLGEIRMFAGPFAPVGWMFCEGQLLPISENENLFNLIGTTYGGDGQTNFALPDLRGRIPIHMGTNPTTGTNFTIGETGGVEEVTLSTQQMPSHGHPLLVSEDPASTADPNGNVLATTSSATPYSARARALDLSPQAITSVGGSQPHTNFQPYLCVNFIIALYGIFPHQ